MLIHTNKIKIFFITLVAALPLAIPVFASNTTVYAAKSSSSHSTCPDGYSTPNNNGICPTCQQAGGCDYGKTTDPASKCNKKSCDLIAKYVNPTINVLSGLVGLIAAASIIFAGIQYSSSDGDPQKAAKAKSRITNTLLALIMYLFLFAFFQFLIPGGVFNR